MTWDIIHKKTPDPPYLIFRRLSEKIANWVRTNFRKEKGMRVRFSDGKIFDIDGVFSSQNDREWAQNYTVPNEIGGIRTKRKHSTNAMIWLGACSKGVTPESDIPGWNSGPCPINKASSSSSPRMWK